ncbi:MAG: thiamine phosphate synthase, partial [Pseudomonadota bacterium]
MTDQAGAPRLYLVTPPLEETDGFAPLLDAALAAAPVVAVRLRTAREDEAAIRRAADVCREVCHGRDVALL